ncbi:hypothetical protein RI129_009254 [Pyrocoelia pectoralis]|uniref:Uncharacterized protein n=1 Tax=Pyrocoelia pectoralis TaxID=417401 RepID=A0AAN7V480_9COLE
MQPHVKKPPSDEEEDLESLRLAALQSLKRSASNIDNLNLSNNNTKLYKKANKRGRGCHTNTRMNRNGIFGSRVRNSTLIAVPTIETETYQTNSNKMSESSSKLILPQDRYTKQAISEEKSESGSKFDRYKDSESESESDSEDIAESQVKLERSSSLEALMQELENEIQRDTKNVEIQKVKPQKKVTKVKTDPNIILKDVKPVVDVIENKAVVQIQKPNLPQPTVPKSSITVSENPSIVYSNSQASFLHNQFLNFIPSPCSANQFDPHVAYNFPVVNSFDAHLQPKYYERPLSPLPFDTGVFNTITAPLSPRSAAFVLQNREIIERRKKSPRRSYSRSPSPRYRRSKSRSPSPLRQKLSPASCNSIRRSQCYKRQSPSRYNSPKRRRRSPANRSNFRTSPYKEVELKEHVQTRDVSLSLSPSPERFVTQNLLEDKKLIVDDSILEARRRKFENDAIPTEGIIRLKPKVEQNEEQLIEDGKSAKNETSSFAIDVSSKLNKNDLPPSDDNYIDFNLKVADLFSDEDSDNENEGRFKSKSNDSSINEQVESIKNESHKRKGKDDLRSKRCTDYEHDTRANKIERREQDSLTSLNANLKHKSRLSPLENRKIEIKIRNPRKYEVENESDDRIKDKKIHLRKVEVASGAASNQVLQSDSEENENDVKNEGSGDLRAQLSRKRAERQHMAPKVENIPSRLLQNALQSAVFKKSKKVKSKKKEKTLSALGNLFHLSNSSKYQLLGY